MATLTHAEHTFSQHVSVYRMLICRVWTPVCEKRCDKRCDKRCFTGTNTDILQWSADEMRSRSTIRRRKDSNS